MDWSEEMWSKVEIKMRDQAPSKEERGKQKADSRQRFAIGLFGLHPRHYRECG
jgi:hypothetical protein